MVNYPFAPLYKVAIRKSTNPPLVSVSRCYIDCARKRRDYQPLHPRHQQMEHTKFRRSDVIVLLKDIFVATFLNTCKSFLSFRSWRFHLLRCLCQPSYFHRSAGSGRKYFFGPPEMKLDALPQSSTIMLIHFLDLTSSRGN